MSDSDYLSTSNAIRALFNIELSKHKALKDGIMSLVRNRSKHEKASFLQIKTETQSPYAKILRDNHYIHRNSLTKFHNAVVLQAFFMDMKTTKAIFSSQEKRKIAADLITVILQGRQSVLAMPLQSVDVEKFIRIINSEDSLEEVRLPNIFPDIAGIFEDCVIGIKQALLVQSAALSTGESMMIYFFNGELEQAYQVACAIESENEILIQYQQLIQRQYIEAKEFDDFLDDLLI